MDCKKDANLARCNCSYEPCSRKGVCCDCLAYHLKSRELPGLLLPGRRRAHLRPHVRALRPPGGEGQNLTVAARPGPLQPGSSPHDPLSPLRAAARCCPTRSANSRHPPRRR